MPEITLTAKGNRRYYFLRKVDGIRIMKCTEIPADTQIEETAILLPRTQAGEAEALELIRKLMSGEMSDEELRKYRSVSGQSA